jgi:hypothetical protein
MTDFKQFMMMLTHFQGFASGSKSSVAGEKTLSVSHAQDGPQPTIWTRTSCVLRHGPFWTIRSIDKEVGVSLETVGR